MLGRLGPRFALEAGFLIVLAVLAGVADLSWPLIVLVMGLAWLLVTIVEVAHWKEGPRVPAPVPRSYAERWAAPGDDVTRVIPREDVEAAAAARPELGDDLRPAGGKTRRRRARSAAPPGEAGAGPAPRHLPAAASRARDRARRRGEGLDRADVAVAVQVPPARALPHRRRGRAVRGQPG